MIYHLTKSHIGGGGVYAQRVSDALCTTGYPSAVLCAENGSLTPSGRLAPLFDRVLAGVLHRCSSQTFHTFLRRTCWRPAAKIGPSDVLHLHSVTGFIGVRGLRRLIPRGAKVFWTAHNPWMFTGGCVAYAGCDNFELSCYQCPILPPPLRAWARVEHRAKRSFARDYSVQPIANSEWMAGLIKRSTIYGELGDIPVVPPIVDSVFRIGGEGAAVRAALGISPDRFVVGLLSRAVTDAGKGIGKFFKALPVDRGFLAKTTFIIIGDGRVALQSAADHRFTGHVGKAAELAGYYRAMDLFVSPSSMETFGMALLEAQACGTPVAAFATGGTPEAVCPDSVCRLVPNGDFGALIGVIEEDFARRIEWAQYAEALHQWVAARHNPAVIAGKQVEIYQKYGFCGDSHGS